jgi:hypothetical protein
MLKELTNISNLFRLLLVEILLDFAIKIAPSNHPDTKVFLKHINAYLDEIIKKEERKTDR